MGIHRHKHQESKTYTCIVYNAGAGEGVGVGGYKAGRGVVGMGMSPCPLYGSQMSAPAQSGALAKPV